MKLDVTSDSTSVRTSRFAPSPPTSEDRRRRDKAVPDYLFRSYWWAYLWPPAVWFFDHQPIINAILFGQYRKLLKACLELLSPAAAGRTLQIAAVYGVLTPTLAHRLATGALHLNDVAPIQLSVVRRKLPGDERGARLCRANAESLPYADGVFDSALLFFLLHELPPAARLRVLREATRVVAPGGNLVVADYGELSRSHPFHRIPALRRLLEVLEPYLGDFWRENLDDLVVGCARKHGRSAAKEAARDVFGGFYRLRRYRIG